MRRWLGLCFFAFTLLASLAFSSEAQAGTLTGYVSYFNQDGRVFPVRKASLYLVRQNTILVQGETDDSGTYSLNLLNQDLSDASIVVRAQASFLSLYRGSTVMEFGPNGGAYFYEEVLGGVGANFQTMGSVRKDISIPADKSLPFNYFDNMIWGFDYLQAHVPGFVPRTLVIYYPSPGHCYYQSHHIFLNSGASDDTFYHEFGHFAQDILSINQTLGGDHYIGEEKIDPRLAFAEGFADYFSSAVRLFAGPNLYSRPCRYVNTAGGQFNFDFEIEGPDPFGGRQTNELAVAAALWDLIDAPGAPLCAQAEDFDWFPLADKNSREMQQMILEALIALKFSLVGGESTTLDAWYRRWEQIAKADILSPREFIARFTGKIYELVPQIPLNGILEHLEIYFFEDGPMQGTSPGGGLPGSLGHLEPNDALLPAINAGVFWMMYPEDFPLTLTLFATDNEELDAYRSLHPDHLYDRDCFLVVLGPIAAFYPSTVSSGACAYEDPSVLRQEVTIRIREEGDGLNSKLEVYNLAEATHEFNLVETSDQDTPGIPEEITLTMSSDKLITGPSCGIGSNDPPERACEQILIPVPFCVSHSPRSDPVKFGWYTIDFETSTPRSFCPTPVPFGVPW